ncbi:VCBS repeat-containing protein [Kitasatospora sp. MMS16-BH015]|uniref:VCBS repeat-containing protein n=1 Tax=Kitasatospora sp. MMS16-BH015 TaxID=2018025 RepID=UPI000CF25A53|nr:VCBS repeat-containing protein [Kitasatospora sp. MMS16-BH015]
MNPRPPAGPHGRRRRQAATTLGAALSLALLTTGALAPAASAVTPAAPAAPQTSADDEAQAEARRSGKPVEVLERRDEHTEVLANPDGTFTWRQHVRPVHAKVGGQWKTPDATLRAEGGRVAPVAATFPMSFSGGGSGPLATMTQDGKSVSLSFPVALPAPELDGASALYREVLPGVDLKVLAETDGFAHHLIVKTREAAADPRLATLSYGLKTTGVSVAADASGTLAATDASGTPVFRAPAPTMWDSSHLQAGAPAAAPAAPAASPAAAAQSRALRAAPAPAAATPSAPAPSSSPDSADHASPEAPAEAVKMPVEVIGGELRLTPDQKLLTSPDTVFPVVIDPAFSGGGRVNWTMAYKQRNNAGAANTSYWNGDHFTDKLPRLGYEDDPNYATYGTARSFFQMDTRGLGGAQVVSATFNVFNNYTWSCTATPVELGYTNAIDPNSTWNNQPAWAQTLQEKSFAHGRTDCGAAGEDFNSDALKQLVQRAADGNWNDITLGLRSRADFEGNDQSWKKFNNDPHLEVTYNHPPVLNEYGAYQGPWSPGSTSAKAIACSTDPATWPVVGNNDVTLTARVSDPDGGNLTAHFGIWQHGGAAVQAFDPVVASGTWAQGTVKAGQLSDGKSYRWAVQAQDGITTSPLSPSCGFTVDRTPPAKPTVTAADSGDQPARTERTLKLAATDAFGLDGFCYSLNKPLPTGNTKCAGGTWAPAAADGTATIKLTPTLWPTNQLHVQAYDKAGNLSAYDGAASPATNSTEIKTTSSGFVGLPDGGSNGDLPGDLDGDGYADFVADGPDGQLRFYAGDGTGNVAAARVVSTSGWRGALIAHRGDFASNVTGQTKDGYEDYVVKLGSKLYVYPNDGLGNPQYDKRTELKHPTGDWSATTQILATGNIDRVPGSDLLVKDGDSLVLFSGTTAGPLATSNGKLIPVTVAASGFARYDLLAPGDLDGDGAADLLARNTTTNPADPEFGKLYLYPGSNPERGQYQLGAPTVYAAGGWDRLSRPALTSPGNVHGKVDKAADGTRTFTPTVGQESPDIWSTTATDASVAYQDATGAKKADCPTGCLLLTPGTPTGIGTAPALVGNGSWGSTYPADGTPAGTATEYKRPAGTAGAPGSPTQAAAIAQTSAVTAAGLPNGDTAYVTVSNGREFIQWHYADGSWSGVELIDTTSTSGTRYTDTTAVAATADGTGRLQIVSTGNGQLHHQTWTAAGGWTRFDTPPGIAAKVTAVAAAGLKDGSAQFMAVVNGVEYHQIRYANATWSGFNLLGNSGVTAVAAAATPNGDVQFMSVVGGVEYHQVRYAADLTWSGFNRLGNANVTAVAATGNADGSAQFVSVAGGSQYWQARNIDGTWTAFNQTATAVKHSALAGYPTAPAGSAWLNTTRLLGLAPQ